MIKVWEEHNHEGETQSKWQTLPDIAEILKDAARIRGHSLQLQARARARARCMKPRENHVLEYLQKRRA